MIMQNLGVTNKEHYGMLWRFLEWSSVVKCKNKFKIIYRNLLCEYNLKTMLVIISQCTFRFVIRCYYWYVLTF